MHKMLVAVFCLLVSSISYSAEKADFLQFFNEYQRLSLEFDASISKMYADDAKIKGERKKPDGTAETMTIDGARWKTIIMTSMERARQLGDRSEYSDIAIEVVAGRAKITATRFSALDCFTDNRFYMVVESTADEQLQIVEQFTETPVQSSCEESETELPEFLENTARMINEQLPAAIDAETHLIKISADGSKLTYNYVLINHTSETLSTEEATEKLQTAVVQQSCGSPNMRPILDQGGSLAYIYRGSDAVQIARFDIDKTACAG